MFRKGDRVAYKATGDTGTVTRKRGDVVRVQWDDGFETPVHPLELAHTEKDRSASDQEIAAALPTNPSEKESVMTNITNYPTADLVAEADRRGMQVPANLRAETPPAGFRAYTVQDTINGEPFGEPYVEYVGPGAHHGAISIESSWSEHNGVLHFVTNDVADDNGIFSTEELIELGKLIREVVTATKVSTAENVGIKVCTTCNEGKPLSDFSKHVSNRDGLQSHCKDCAAEYYAKGKITRNEDDNDA